MLLSAASVSQRKKGSAGVFLWFNLANGECNYNWNLKGNFWKYTTARARGPLCYVMALVKLEGSALNWWSCQLLAYFDIPVFALWSTLILVLLAPNMSQTLNAKCIFKMTGFFFFFHLLPLDLKFIVYKWSILSQRLCTT